MLRIIKQKSSTFVLKHTLTLYYIIGISNGHNYSTREHREKVTKLY